jgi:hypothetical protein
MEGRITTPPTTSGVQKRAGQSKAEGISKPNIGERSLTGNEIPRIVAKHSETIHLSIMRQRSF